MKISEVQVLLEYNRQVTIQRWGPKLYAAFKGDQSFHINPSLKDACQIIMDRLERADPTPHKEYVQTLVKWYAQRHTRMEDLTSRGNEALQKFDMLKRRGLLDPKHRDIGKFYSFAEFEETMELAYQNYEQQEVVNKGKAHLFYEDTDLKIIIPKDQDAACYYGQGTRWCTAAKNNNMFGNYTQGPLYIILPKKPLHVGEKFQFHFPTEQFMNETDAPVDMFKMGERYPQLRRIFRKEAKEKGVMGLLYSGVTLEYIRKATRLAVVESITDPLSRNKLKLALTQAVQATLVDIWGEFPYIRKLVSKSVSDELFKKCVATGNRILSSNDLTINWMIEHLRERLGVHPDAINDQAKFEDILHDSIEEMTHGRNSISDTFQPIFDLVMKEYGDDRDELMEVAMSTTWRLLEQLSTPLYHEIRSKLETKISQFRVNIDESLDGKMRAKEFTEAKYRGNIGAMEMFRFYKIATPEQKQELRQLMIAIGSARRKADSETEQTLLKQAWDTVQNITGMKLNKSGLYEEDSYQPPTINVGDEIKFGKFKNRKAEVKGFTKDKNNQPVLKTNKGNQQLFKPRISKLITEGGNIFKNKDGSPATDRIFKTDVVPTVQWLEKLTGLPLVDNMLGTTGRKESSGDLDLAVDSNSITKEDLVKVFADWCSQNGLDSRDFVRKSGDSVHFRTPIGGDPGRGFVQTDFMLGEPAWQRFAMAGGGENSPYKGMHRHLLMASIAKALGLKWSYKNGLVSRTTDKTITRDPEYIAEILLGQGHSKDDLSTVESIWKSIQGRPDFDEIIQFFKTDLEREGLPMPGTINTK